ncbi:MAG: hypothetical protein JST02_02765, partial [Bacteroidetes bacterium]|nr:hypothetical protein [Bacteroidota bacterium]
MTTFNGTSGNDTLSGSSDADTLIGGLGDDLYLINHISDVAIETDTSDENHDTIRTSVLTSLSIYTIENLSGIENLEYIGIAPSILKGNSKANIISANSSADSNDSIYGGDGDDSLYSFGGNDYLMGGNGNDTLDGGTGADIMIGGSGDDTYFIDNIGDIAIELSTASTSYLETPGFDIAFSNGALKDMRNGWALNIEGLVYTGTTSIRIDGNSSDNYLASQSTTPDTIFGYDGNDTLDGGSGPDLLTGGTGDDVYFVDSNDTINENTNEGTDTFIGTITDISIAAFSNSIENLIYTGINSTPLKGNNLNNAIIGGNGSDTISGFEGNDTLIGGIGADSLIGGNGNDYLYGGGSPAIPDIHNHDLNKISEFNIDHVSDTLIGGTGNDNYLIDDEQDIILEVSGSANGFDAIESLIDNSLNQSKYANVEALVLYNPEPNDITVDANMPWYGEGSSAANVIVGNDRENFLSGGAGNDTLCGDLDGQVIFYDDPNELSPVTDILDGGENDDILLALFNYSPSQAGRPVNNVLLGGSGNDVYVLASNQTICYDSAGTDSALFLISGSIESFDGMENILLWGNAPTLQNAATIALNNIALATNTSGLSFNTESIYAPQALNATGNYLNNLVWGNSLDNFLSGLDGNDSIVGNNGNDTLVGGNGIDTLVGGNGDDTYVVDTGDIIVEATNGGVDVIRSATLTNYGAFANIEGIEYTGTANVLLKGATNNTINEKLIGNTGNDTILGYGGNDSIAGNDGNDSLDGGNSNDTILGGTGKDTIFGGDGNDLLYGNNVLNGLFDPASGMTDDASAILGGNGNDTIYGGNSADGLNGGEGNDWIYGFAGNDTIVGGNGTNNLSGGDGNDSITGGTGTD